MIIQQACRTVSGCLLTAMQEMTAPFPHLMEGWKDEIMNGRVAEPDDIKGCCVFLASDESRYCTGADFRVDGGVTMW